MLIGHIAIHLQICSYGNRLSTLEVNKSFGRDLHFFSISPAAGPVFGDFWLEDKMENGWGRALSKDSLSLCLYSNCMVLGKSLDSRRIVISIPGSNLGELATLRGIEKYENQERKCGRIRGDSRSMIPDFYEIHPPPTSLAFGERGTEEEMPSSSKADQINNVRVRAPVRLPLYSLLSLSSSSSSSLSSNPLHAPSLSDCLSLSLTMSLNNR